MANGSNGRASIGAGATNRRWGILRTWCVNQYRLANMFGRSEVQSVDQRMRLGMRCRLSPTADVPFIRSAHWRGRVRGHPEKNGLLSRPHPLLRLLTRIVLWID